MTFGVGPYSISAPWTVPPDAVSRCSDHAFNSGRLPELLTAVEAARAAGADVIAITSSGSPLAKKATVCLAVDHAEDSTSFLSMISRILQLLLIDILSVGISVDAQNAELVLERKAGDGVEADSRRLLISHLDS